MEKVMRIGTIPRYEGRRASVFIKVHDTRGYWSFTGVIGPMRSGNAIGGCGQIDMEFAHRKPEDNDSRQGTLYGPEDINFAAGWDSKKWLRLLDLWLRYHMKQAMPENIENWIKQLPDTDRQPAWV